MSQPLNHLAFLVCYQNPQTLEWYWLCWARTQMSARAIIQSIWGHKPSTRTQIWQGHITLDETFPFTAAEDLP